MIYAEILLIPVMNKAFIWRYSLFHIHSLCCQSPAGSQTHCSQSGCTIPHLWKGCQAFLAVYLHCGTQKKSKWMYKQWRDKEVIDHRIVFIYTCCLLQRNCLLEANISHLIHPHISPKSVGKYSGCWGTRTMSQKCASRHTLSRISQGIKTIAKISQDD